MTSLLRPRLFVLGLGVALAASLAGVAPPAPAQIPRRSIPTESDVRRLLSALADDSLEGRATGTPGSARAARIIAAEMQRIGLEPAGDSGYFQRVPVAVATQSRTMPNGTVVTRTRPVGYASFAALDTVPVARRRTAVNVVGRLRGSDPVLRDSVVLVDAHYDHLGVGTAVNGDSIYNGADDDASGVVAVLEAARALAAGPAPKRTVLFVATTGEEVGLLGTRWFIAHPAVPLSQLTANLEIEMIGRPDSLAGGPGRAWLTGYERSTMGAMFAAAGLPIVADRRLAQQFFTRSDNIAFAQMGIPAHTLSSYNMHEDYHHPSDDVAHVDFAHMTAVVHAAAQATRLLADGPTPRWNEGGRPAAPVAPTATRPTPLPSNPSQLPPASPAERLARYTTVRLAPDTAGLTRWERRMLPLLIDAAREMHGIYWMQAFGNRDSLLRNIPQADVRRLVEINVGPWDRLDDNAPFVAGAGPKPAGANFYPRDMTKDEFERAVAPGGRRADSLKSLYTMVRRDGRGELVAIPYGQFFASANERAAAKLREAATLAEDPGLRRYLTLLATALVTDRYQPSDLAWMDMKRNRLELVLGPIETYEDELFGYKAANEAFVLVKDLAWSQRLAKYARMLPALQRGIPVPAAYKRERPGTDADLNAYDVVYVAGQANVGSKTIAINLPNDETVQLRKGTRRLQLKNAMRAKYDRILLPIAQELIVDDQLPHVTFDAFFENVMFHEVAHGLGIKNTIDGKGTVRAALKEKAGALEEGKADILGLYMVRQLNAQGEMGSESIDDNYVTFLASLFRSVRFGAADAHGRANVVAFNYLQDAGAFTREANGKYRVDVARMRSAADALSRDILTLQGNGDYAGVARLYSDRGTIGAVLRGDLDRLRSKGIPVDIVYDQGR
ncbi:MAG: M20/M25/M40 family metallo-hydrolase [Gemmatimonadaceae bacterium]|nr:M20/M25/M40 family metallo-hydrolase [Gemmatimonadaceae bacterium]NUR33333.1 M20/M25/M40 family metallo-hydrolase [Gemmatimonadaceae bacterium]NUS33215.1 M20/M25/M40 family metallo-hydrolase [Gemmatimonadaceae bacterium]